MKKLFFLTLIILSIKTSFSQENTGVITDSTLMEMNIFDFCKALGIPSEYNKRYEAIILPLCDAGKFLFDKKSNPYVSKQESLPIDINGRSLDCYLYIGTGQQNETLKRNILANKHLIIKGEVSLQNAKKWKIVK
jgi:hypothetical protein